MYVNLTRKSKNSIMNINAVSIYLLELSKLTNLTSNRLYYITLFCKVKNLYLDVL